jgi:type VI secretion system protein ImpM
VPDPDLIPGFFGKLPSTGDFVTRGLPPAFTTAWDRWLARHLGTRLAPDAPPLYFRRAGTPPVSGVILASHDRAGRRFPLTLAVAGDADPAPLAALGAEAIAEALTPDALATRLAGLRLPPASPDGGPTPLLLWTDPTQPLAADPDAPGPVLAALLGAAVEAG